MQALWQLALTYPYPLSQLCEEEGDDEILGSSQALREALEGHERAGEVSEERV